MTQHYPLNRLELRIEKKMDRISETIRGIIEAIEKPNVPCHITVRKALYQAGIAVSRVGIAISKARPKSKPLGEMLRAETRRVFSGKSPSHGRHPVHRRSPGRGRERVSGNPKG